MARAEFSKLALCNQGQDSFRGTQVVEKNEIGEFSGRYF